LQTWDWHGRNGSIQIGRRVLIVVAGSGFAAVHICHFLFVAVTGESQLHTNTRTCANTSDALDALGSFASTSVLRLEPRTYRGTKRKRGEEGRD